MAFIARTSKITKGDDFLMRKLANLIETELEKQEICAVYDSELARVWPKRINSAKRKQQIMRFANKHRLAVTFYDVGLCAIFEKPRRIAGERTVLLSLDPKRTPSARKRR